MYEKIQEVINNKQKTQKRVKQKYNKRAELILLKNKLLNWETQSQKQLRRKKKDKEIV